MNRDPWTPVVVFGVLLAGCVSTSCVAPKAASKRRRTITQERADLRCEQFIQPAPAPATRGERSRHNSDRDKSGVQRLNPSGLSVVIVNDFPEGKAPQANTWVYALTAGALSWRHPLQSKHGRAGFWWRNQKHRWGRCGDVWFKNGHHNRNFGHHLASLF